jgi:5-methylcytosine-specific restriction enzyme subunit McrC
MGIPADAISSTYDLVGGDKRYRIVDANFYRQLLGKVFDAKKVHSANLYQMTRYLMNAPAVSGIETEGMSIYPKVDRVLRERYTILGRKISVCTVDLDAPWGPSIKRFGP